MPTARLTRRVRFAAAHRYRRPEWSDEENTRVFGACARPNYHGHTYQCVVTVEGEIDPLTGMVVDLARLDAALGAEVMARFDHRNINLDVPEFAEGSWCRPARTWRGSSSSDCRRRWRCGSCR